MQRNVVVDCDGVIAQDQDNLPYSERKPYSFVAKYLHRLRESGFAIIIQTARYMIKCDGNKQKAEEAGYLELKTWLNDNGIPWDEIHFGKVPTSTYYVDDRGFNLRSNDGESGWQRLMTHLNIEE